MKLCLLPQKVPSPSYPARLRDLQTFVSDSVRLPGALTELQILASGRLLMSDIIYLLVVWEPLVQITFLLTLTPPEPRMSINGDICPESTSSGWVKYLWCPCLLFHYWVVMFQNKPHKGNKSEKYPGTVLQYVYVFRYLPVHTYTMH